MVLFQNLDGVSKNTEMSHKHIIVEMWALLQSSYSLLADPQTVAFFQSNYEYFRNVVKLY